MTEPDDNGGPAPLPTELVPVGELSEHPENYNRGDDERVAELLRRFGQWRPAVVQRSTGRVLIGNTMLRAARDRLGWAELNVHYRDVDDDEARRILVADNHASDFAMTDERALARLLQSFGDDLSGTLFEEGDVDDLLAAIEEADADNPPQPSGAPLSGVGGAYGEGGEAEGRGVRQTPSYSEYEAAYAGRTTRFIALVYPLGQYAWIVGKLSALADELGVDNSAEVVLHLVAERVGETGPAEDAEVSPEAVQAAEAAVDAERTPQEAT